jgi:ABC-type uncharacterized transport system ATPase subunit
MSNGMSPTRVDEVLELVGLTDVAKKRVGQFSLGMKQRLGIASVMLGDPKVVILDEPANGLDPEGIRWIREMLKHLASQGRSVLVSSHLLSEMALMADDLIVIGKGRLITECTVPDFIDRYAKKWVVVKSPQLDSFVSVAQGQGMHVSLGQGVAEFHGVDAATIGELAAKNNVVLHELSTQTGSLEDAFLEEHTVSNTIGDLAWDYIVYAKMGRDEGAIGSIPTAPLWHIVSKYYNSDRIVFLYGEDSAKSPGKNDVWTNHLNAHAQHGRCFVRELV